MNQKLETCGQGWFEQGAESIEETYRVLTLTPHQHLSLNHKLTLYTDEVMLNWPLRAASRKKLNPKMSPVSWKEAVSVLLMSRGPGQCDAEGMGTGLATLPWFPSRLSHVLAV